MSGHRPFLQKKTKIICTIGPACQSKEILVEMIHGGMNVARLNCSHGDHDTLEKWIKNIRAAEKETGIPIPIIIDLQGPKIRIGLMEDGKPVRLDSEQEFTITTEEVLGNVRRVSTTYTDLPEAISVGDDIFINDGLVRLKVKEKTDKEILTIVQTGGVISDHKGINVPGGHFKRRGLTPKDKQDIQFALKQDVEIIAVSFVEKASDVQAVRKELGDAAKNFSIIAKIERMAAVESINEILNAADGIMVARGDLGVEIKPEKVPLTQKDILRKAIERQRTTIVATQMLETMTNGPQPTRAEVSDVANSILDNADGLMLSTETAMGVNPVEAVKMMSRIALEVEKNSADVLFAKRRGTIKGPTDAVTWAAVEAAEALDISKIVVFTETGRAAQSLSLRRPRQEIIAFTPNPKTLRQVQVLHSVHPHPFPSVRSFERLIAHMEKVGEELELFHKDEMVIVVAGPPGVSGGTNLLKVHKIGEL